MPIYLESLEFKQRNLLKPPDFSAIAVVEFECYAMYASADDGAVGRHVLNKQYELDVTAFCQRTLLPGMNVVDIGANIGYFTMVAAAVVGESGEVFTIEPNPANVRLLEASRRLNSFGNVTVAQLAAGLRVLSAGQSNGTISVAIGRPVASVVDHRALCRDRQSPCAMRSVDFMKIDAESAEYDALLGASQIISRDKPLIVSEFSPSQLVGISGIDGAGSIRWLIGQGYYLGVLMMDGSVEAVGDDYGRIMETYRAHNVDYVDIVASASA